MKTDSPVGQKYEYLTVVEQLPLAPGQRHRKWKCLCVCGNSVTSSAHNVRQGFRKSCGCRWRKSYGEISGAFLCRLRNHAKERGLDFAVDAPYIWRLYLAQNRRCALSGLPIKFGLKRNTASLDRIDSSKGYLPGNVQWLHKDVNFMKLNFDQAYFLRLVSLIASNSVKTPLISKPVPQAFGGFCRPPTGIV